MTPVLMAACLLAGVLLGLRVNARRVATLREQLRLSVERHDAWNLNAKATDLAEVGPVTPATGTVELFDGTQLAEWREQTAAPGLDDGLVWCVRSNEGWCAVADDTEPAEGSWFVETLCGYGITLPSGYDRRRPDCAECVSFCLDNELEAEDDTTPVDCPEAGGCRRPEQCETGCHWLRLRTLNRGVASPVDDDPADTLPRVLPEGRISD